MRHDQGTNQAGRNTPRGSPSIVALAILINESHVEGPTEVLTQEVRGTSLQSLTILHHRLDRIGIQGTCETLRGRFHTLDHRHSHVVLGEVGIDSLHTLCLFLSLLTSGVSGVALLPKELSRTEEQACTHLPTHHVSPLVTQDRQVPIRLDPVAVCIPDNGLRSRSDDQLLLQFRSGIDHDTRSILIGFQAIVSHHCALLSESLDMLRLFAEERFRDQQGEIGVDMACLLEFIIEYALHLFPNRIAIGLDHHATTHSGVLSQISLDNQILIPLRVIHTPGGKFFQLFCHFLLIVSLLCFDFTLFKAQKYTFFPSHDLFSRFNYYL